MLFRLDGKYVSVTEAKLVEPQASGSKVPPGAVRAQQSGAESSDTEKPYWVVTLSNGEVRPLFGEIEMIRELLEAETVNKHGTF